MPGGGVFKAAAAMPVAPEAGAEVLGLVVVVVVTVDDCGPPSAAIDGFCTFWD